MGVLMNAQIIALLLSLACWLASPHTLVAHGQISGTILRDGTVTQNKNSASNQLPDLQAAAERALEQGEHREALSLYIQMCFADSSAA